MDKTVFIIAEAGVNHNGCLETARKMVDAACEAEANAVKFQTFLSENIVTPNAVKAEYQKKDASADELQLDMLKKLELSREDHKELKDYCEKKNIMFMSTPFDMEAIDFLDSLDMEIFKIPSGEIVNLPYLRKIGGLGKKVIMSTGMSSMREIEEALSVLKIAGTPKDDITVLHCNTEYPTPEEDVNLSAMLAIKEAFDVKVGYSDHTLGIEVPLAAAAIGASVIEKHFTLSRQMEGPDHKSSMEPHELKIMVGAVRKIEKVMGQGLKEPSRSEIANMTVVRKSLVAVRGIKMGEVFTADNVTAKRPGTGINPMRWDEVIGKTASKDFKKDDFIEL